MTIKNCPNCGGEHWGSYRCPLLPEEIAKSDAVRLDREHREAAVHHGTAAPDLAPSLSPAPAPAEGTDCEVAE